MKAIILLFVVLGAAFASNTQLFASLAEIDKDPFGSTILSAIALNLKAKQTLSDVTNLLQGILDDLLVDQQALETSWNQKRDLLDRAIADGKSLIGSYDAAIASLEESITTDTAARDTKQTTLANTRAALAFEQNRLATLDQEYNTRVPQFDADVTDLGAAKTAVSNALQKMQAFQASAGAVTSLLEVASNTQKDMMKVSDTITRMKKTLSRRSNLYTPLVRELLDLTNNMDQSRAARVSELLQQLYDLLSTALTDVQGQRATFIATNRRERQDAADNIATYTGRIAQLEQDIANLEVRIGQARADLQVTRDLRATAQAKLDADTAALAAARAFYEDQAPRYTRLIDTMRLIIDHVTTNLAGVDAYTRSQLQGGAAL